MKTPIVSVVMPVYNAGPYLAQAVDSILEQTLDDLELIVVDDGSGDGSRELLAQRAQRDQRVQLVDQDHAGVTAALNTGLKAVRGRFIARMDADDVAAPCRFERQHAYLESYPRVVAVGTAVLQIDPDGLPIAISRRPEDHETLVEELNQGRGGLAHPTAFMRREAVEACGGYDERYRVGQDKPLWTALAKQGRLANMPDVLLCYRRHLKSITATRDDMQPRAVAKGSPLLPPQPARQFVPVDLDHYADWSKRAVLNGYGVTARKYAMKYFRHRPWQPSGWWWLARSFTIGTGALPEGFRS